MHNFDDWYEGNIINKLCPKTTTSSQDISRLINLLGKQEVQQRFFKNYIAKFFPNTSGLLIDSTALPSSINSSINSFGHTSEGIQENITCLMLVDKKSKLPIYFRAIGGDISDVSTLQTTIKEIKHLGLSADSAILDAGYCSKDNLIYLCKEKIDFLTRLPKSHGIFYTLIDDIQCTESHANAVQYGERVIFIKSKEATIYGEKLYAHVILDHCTKLKDTTKALKDSFDIDTTNNDTLIIDKKLKYSGYFILLSRTSLEKQDVLPAYYVRQNIEQIFGFSKSNNSLLPLRVHSEQSINGYLLLTFIALILFIGMRQRLMPTISMEKALLQLRALKAKVYDDEILIQEPNKKIKDIIKKLNIILPITLGI